MRHARHAKGEPARPCMSRAKGGELVPAPVWAFAPITNGPPVHGANRPPVGEREGVGLPPPTNVSDASGRCPNRGADGYESAGVGVAARISR